MKLLLLQPPVQDYYDTEVRLQPIGLCYLKAAVQKHFPRVEVIVEDFHAGHGRRTVPLPKEFRDLGAYYPARDLSPFSLFSRYYHFGARFEDIAAAVAREKPDLVGISSLFSTYQEEAIRCAREIKKLLDVPIVMGGSHPTALPEAVLADPGVDFVIRGEGERPLVRLVDALASASDLASVPNLGYRVNGACRLNDLEDNYPIEDLPLPDLSDLNRAFYASGGRPIAAVVSSRGCPYRCDFCSVHPTFGNVYRRRSDQSILDEMRLRYAAGYRVFDFEDDNFTFDRRQTERLLHDVAASFPPDSLELVAMNGLCYFGLDAELLHLMKKAGFSQLNLSLVSANPQVCAAHRRSSDLPGFQQAVQEGFRLGMGVIGYQILGLPGETVDSMAETMALLARLPLLIGASIFYLAPGCALWERDQGRVDQLKFARLTALPTHSDLVSRDDLYTLLVTARVINFLKSLDVGTGPETSLDQALDQAADKRSNLGARLLRGLLADGRLLAWDGRQVHSLDRFQPEVFQSLWSKIGGIQTTSGQILRL